MSMRAAYVAVKKIATVSIIVAAIRNGRGVKRRKIGPKIEERAQQSLKVRVLVSMKLLMSGGAVKNAAPRSRKRTAALAPRSPLRIHL